jgi:hypothetical protein
LSDLIDGRLRWHLGEAERAQHFLQASERVSYVFYCFVFARANKYSICMHGVWGSDLFIVLGNLRGKFTIFILLIEAFWRMPLYMGRREWVRKEGREGKQRRGSDPNVPPFDE